MVNILFGGNDKVFDGILLCLMSMTKHTSEDINVYILTADITEINAEYRPISQDKIKFLENYLKNKNPNNTVNLISMSEQLKNWILCSKNKLNVYTPYAFLRLFADSLKELPDKIIYLDCDIMINGDIKELYDIDITNYELGVVLDRYGHIFIKPKYFNSGMLLMNLKKIRETKLFDNVKKMCLEKKMGFPDQSALNMLTKAKLYLPRKFNEQGNLRKDTIIHHFCKRIKWLPFFHTQNVKQWHVDDVKNKYKIHQYDDIYDEYFKIKKDL